jgi:alpha/beta superfamily hydrolase
MKTKLPQPAYFGGQNRRLFGMYHDTGTAARRRTGVVLCAPPIGREQISSHRILRVLATQLSRAGLPTLRFDYYGCGDSEGEDEDVSVDGCTSDICAAGEYLKECSLCEQVALVGLGFGATLAALATVNNKLDGRYLVLWDPVLNGAAYVEGLHAEAAANIANNSSALLTLESAGFTVSKLFECEVRAIDSDAVQAIDPALTTVVDSSREFESLLRTVSSDHWLGRLNRLYPDGAPWSLRMAREGISVPMAALRLISQLGSSKWP